MSAIRNVPETELGCCGCGPTACLDDGVPCSVEFDGVFHGFVTLQLLTLAPYLLLTQPFGRKTILYWPVTAGTYC